MTATFRWRLIPLLALLLFTTGRAQDETPASPTPEDLARRFAALQPELERVLGKPFEEAPEFVLATKDELRAAVTAEVKRLLPEARVPEAITQLAGSWVAGKAEWGTNRVLIDLETYYGLAWADRAQAERCLDLLLLHEAAHVYQHKQLGAGDLLESRASDNVAMLAATVLCEVHAQWATRGVARAVDRVADYSELERVFAGPRHVVGELPPAQGFQRRVQTTCYRDGLVFLDKLAPFVGGERAAVKRMLDEPPVHLREFSYPQLYLERVGLQQDWSPQIKTLRQVLFAERAEQTDRQVLNEDTIQALLKLLPPAEQTEAAAILLRGELHGLQDQGGFMGAFLVECVSEKGAARLVELHAAAQEARAKTKGITPRRTRVDDGIHVALPLAQGQEVGFLAFRAGRLYVGVIAMNGTVEALGRTRAAIEERVARDAGFARLRGDPRSR